MFILCCCSLSNVRIPHWSSGLPWLWWTKLLRLWDCPQNCSTNPGWDDLSWSIETTVPGVSSVSLRIYPNFLTFVLYTQRWDVTNIQEYQSGKLPLISINHLGRTPMNDIWSIDLVRRCESMPFQDLNYCQRGYSTSIKHKFSICVGVRYLDLLM